MTIQVTGILKDSSGSPSPNTPIQLITVKGSDGVLPTAVFDTITDVDGNYDFTVNIGIHYLLVRYQNDFEKVGKVTVNSDTPSPLNLDSLLSFDEPLTPEQILQVQQLVSETVEAADRAEAAASSVEGIEQEVEANRAEVAANAQQVSDDKQVVVLAAAQVDQDKNDVTSMTDQVTQYRNEVEADKVEVAANTTQVSNDAAQVAQDKSDTADSALLAQMWAAGENPTNGTPSDTNNAEYWSNRAAQFATGALLYGGLFTPTVTTPYPPTFDTDIMYLVNFADPEETFTFTDGDLNGVTVKNGNAIIYNTPENQYEASSFVFTGVATVNGKSPDASNNVQINASDVGAYSQSETDDLLDEKANSSDVNTALSEKADAETTYTEIEVDNLLAQLAARDAGEEKTYLPNWVHNSPTAFTEKDGTLLLRSEYPELWAVAEINAIEDSEWLAIKANLDNYNGAVQAYSKGDGSTTFRKPDVGTHGAFSRVVGSDDTSVADLLYATQDQDQKITGKIGFRNGYAGSNTSITLTQEGVLAQGTTLDSGINAGPIEVLSTNAATITRDLVLDNSLQIRTGDESKPISTWRSVWICTGRL